MSNTVTLDSIRQAVEAKYRSYDISLPDGAVVKLQNAIRISKENRQKLVDLQTALKAEGADQIALLSDCIRAVADSKRGADALLKMVGDDLAVLAEIFSQYGEATQVGEASASRE